MRKTIIIIDDSPFVEFQVKDMVEGEEYEVIGSAQNGTDGIALYKELQPDYVILDIIMPGIDGLETAAILLSEYPDARIIMLSSVFDEETFEAIKEVGVSYLLPKPVEKEALFDTLQRF